MWYIGFSILTAIYSILYIQYLSKSKNKYPVYIAGWIILLVIIETLFYTKGFR